MYILNIDKTMKYMTIKELKDLIFKNYYYFINKLDLLKKTVIIQ